MLKKYTKRNSKKDYFKRKKKRSEKAADVEGGGCRELSSRFFFLAETHIFYEKKEKRNLKCRKKHQSF